MNTESLILKLGAFGIESLNVGEISELRNSGLYLVPKADGFDADETIKLFRHAALHGWPSDLRWQGKKLVAVKDYLVKDDSPTRSPITGAVLAPGDKWFRVLNVNPDALMVVAHEFQRGDNLFTGMNEVQVVAQMLMPNNPLVEFAVDRLSEAKAEDADSYRNAKKFLNGGAGKSFESGAERVGENDIERIIGYATVNASLFLDLLIAKFDETGLSIVAMKAYGWDLENSGGKNKREKALNLVRRAQMNGWFNQLVTAAILENPEMSVVLTREVRKVTVNNGSYHEGPVVVNTGGGAYIGGSVSTGGDFFGGNKRS